jgi:hypothetical protein
VQPNQSRFLKRAATMLLLGAIGLLRCASENPLNGSSYGLGGGTGDSPPALPSAI